MGSFLAGSAVGQEESWEAEAEAEAEQDDRAAADGHRERRETREAVSEGSQGQGQGDLCPGLVSRDIKSTQVASPVPPLRLI